MSRGLYRLSSGERLLGVRADGRLCLTRIDAGETHREIAPLVIALRARRPDAGGDAVDTPVDDPVWAHIALLCAADGRGVRLADDDEGRPVQGCRARPEAGGGLRLGFERGGRACGLREDDGVVSAVAAEPGQGQGQGQGLVLLPVPVDPAQAGVLATLPEEVHFDFGGLAFAFAIGDPRHLPILDAWLDLLPIARVREAWSTTAAFAARDVFFDLVRAHSRRHLGNFGSYTRDVLRAGIAAHGWSVGEGSYGTPMILEPGRGMLRIGRYCSLANPTIVLGNHAIRSASSFPFIDLWREWPGALAGMSDHTSGDVTIGDNVWIGVDVTLLPRVRIGDGAVIGAGSVVRGDVPPFAICTGNPATVRRMRFAPETVERLLALRWWDWPAARIDRYLHLLTGEDLEPLFAKAAEEDAVTG